jgi:hypothetical protein
MRGRPMPRTQLQIRRSQAVRAYSWIGHLTSCIAGKRSANGSHVDAGQKRLSNCDDRPGAARGAKRFCERSPGSRASKRPLAAARRTPVKRPGSQPWPGSRHASSLANAWRARDPSGALARELRRDAEGRASSAVCAEPACVQEQRRGRLRGCACAPITRDDVARADLARGSRPEPG